MLTSLVKQGCAQVRRHIVLFLVWSLSRSVAIYRMLEHDSLREDPEHLDVTLSFFGKAITRMSLSLELLHPLPPSESG